MITGYTALARMIDILATNAAFDTVTVRLYVDDALTLTPNMLTTDFTEADFDGYAAEALDDTTVIPALNADGDLVATFPHVTFVPTGSTTPNTVYGWWMQGIVAGVGAVVIAAGQLETPALVTGPLTPVQIDARFPIGQPRGS